MIFFNAVVLGITLAMDAFSISVSKALVSNKKNALDGVKLGAVFGIFQAFMPLLGYLIGASFYSLIKNYFGVVSFVILAYLGGKMVYDYFKGEEQTLCRDIQVKELLVLGVATSIDALAAGFCFGSATLPQTLISCLIIGLITFIICFFGYILGSALSEKIGNKSTLFGGIILILLGVKILIESFI